MSFSLWQPRKRTCWRKDNEFDAQCVQPVCPLTVEQGKQRHVAQCVQRSKSCMAWGFIGPFGRDFKFFDVSHIKAPDYQKMVQTTLAPKWPRATKKRRMLTFVQDNARPHTARSSQKMFEDFGWKLMTWPPSSPDMNPIEKLWGVMKNKLTGQRFANEAQLKSSVLQIWREMPETLIESCLNGVPARVAKLLAARGGYTTC